MDEAGVSHGAKQREAASPTKNKKPVLDFFESRGFLLTFEFGGEHGHTPSLPLSCCTTLLALAFRKENGAPSAS